MATTNQGDTKMTTATQNKTGEQIAAEALAKEQRFSYETAFDIVTRDGVERTWNGIHYRRLDRTN